MELDALPNPFPLRYRQASVIVEALGGIVAVSNLSFTPTSTVHSWTVNGMSKARFDHVCLAARARGKATELAAALEAISEEPDLPFETATASASQAAIGSLMEAAEI